MPGAGLHGVLHEVDQYLGDLSLVGVEQDVALLLLETGDGAVFLEEAVVELNHLGGEVAHIERLPDRGRHPCEVAVRFHELYQAPGGRRDCLQAGLEFFSFHIFERFAERRDRGDRVHYLVGENPYQPGPRLALGVFDGGAQVVENYDFDILASDFVQGGGQDGAVLGALAVERCLPVLSFAHGEKGLVDFRADVAQLPESVDVGQTQQSPCPAVGVHHAARPGLRDDYSRGHVVQHPAIVPLGLADVSRLFVEDVAEPVEGAVEPAVEEFAAPETEVGLAVVKRVKHIVHFALDPSRKEDSGENQGDGDRRGDNHYDGRPGDHIPYFFSLL